MFLVIWFLDVHFNYWMIILKTYWTRGQYSFKYFILETEAHLLEVTFFEEWTPSTVIFCQLKEYFLYREITTSNATVCSSKIDALSSNLNLLKLNTQKSQNYKSFSVRTYWTLMVSLALELYGIFVLFVVFSNVKILHMLHFEIPKRNYISCTFFLRFCVYNYNFLI